MERTDPDMVVFVALAILLLNIQASRLVRRLGRIVNNKDYFSPALSHVAVPISLPDHVLEINLSYWPGAGDSKVSTEDTQAMAKKAIGSVYTYIQDKIKSDPDFVSLITLYNESCQK